MDFEQSRIERLKRDLYSRDESRVPKETRGKVSSTETEVPHDWGSGQNFDIPSEAMTPRKKSPSFFTSFFGIALIFFCLSLGVAVFMFFGGLNMISSNNVDIKVIGSSSVSSGEELDADVSIVNQNHTDLQNTVLYVTYPTGTQSVATSSVTLTHDKIVLDTIPAGKTTDYALRALFFGETGAVKTITFHLEYTVKGSDAVFSKDKTYDISIGSSPLILNVTYPQQVNSGQPMTLNIDLTSNSSSVLSNTMVKVTYPYGFTYVGSNIKPQGSGVWNVGDIKNGDKKTLTITGALVGQDQEQRAFLISAGIASPGTSDLNTVLAEFSATVALQKSFFGLTVDSGGAPTAGRPGQSIPVSISWQNTLPDTLVNTHITAVVSGNAFDRSAVTTANSGFYRSVDNTVLWDKTTTDALDSLSSGDTGHVSVTVGSLSDTVLRSIKNPHIDVNVTMTGNRVSDSSPVTSTAFYTIPIVSTLTLSANSYRIAGPFTNTGPIPPRADKQSTYTIMWVLTNTTNDIDSTMVSAKLPQNITWMGQTSPSGEKITYDPNTRTVTWNARLVSYGSGFTFSARKVYFQVGFMPSVTDVGAQQVPLTSNAQVTGTDTYATTSVSGTASTVTTHFADSSFVTGNDTVSN